MAEQSQKKNKFAELEQETLEFWRKNGIFEKTLEKKRQGGKEFVFFEGPPTANGRPGIHHLEARAFKDAIPRYKTMQGFYVRRKGGWDTHGLPVEIQVEKELGLKSKKEIESYGIAAFNEKCKESVWKYVRLWEEFTNRMGYWVDLKNPYITYKPEYIESLWNIAKTVDSKKLLYKDYKVVPWCPRCGTALSSHELAQGYEDVKDLAVTVRFKVKGEDNTYLLAWTTTPWTLPGNVGLAVGEKIQYGQYEKDGEAVILANARAEKVLGEGWNKTKDVSASSIIGKEYEPLYPFLADNISGPEKAKMVNAYKVYPASFVTTEDGTGIVHTAVMYGQDDFELGTKVGLPKFHLVNDDGTFKKEAGFLAGKFVKDEATNVEIIKDLAGRGLLFAKEKYQHSYPFCWRCHTPLIYFARDSWYIRMSALRDKLVKENEKINWEPEHIKEGRFGEWLREVKDWAISRERYWGTPLPVWICDKCGERKVVGSMKELEGTPSGNTFFLMRHGESENNVLGTLNGDIAKNFHLTDNGRKEAEHAGKKLPKKPDFIFASPFPRTKETAEIVAKELGFPKEEIIFDDRLRELKFGVYEGKPFAEYTKRLSDREAKIVTAPEGGESHYELKDRVGDFLKETDAKYQGKTILVVTHEGVIWMMAAAAEGLDAKGALTLKQQGRDFVGNTDVWEALYRHLPRNGHHELDLHRPYIDAVKFPCECGGEMSRVKEVMDVWFDSGSMPFAQDHYPWNKEKLLYPADFISEAIDQTRGWFYTLHAVGTLLDKGRAYNNVICLGHILDAEGKKMSKSIGNVVDPFMAMEKYGADTLRFWMYSVNAPGESKNFDERTVDEVLKKVFNLADNVLSFYLLYASDSNLKAESKKLKSSHVLDQWIMARLFELVERVTEGLESFELLEPTRAIRDFIADLSQWYIRRSRERFKGEDLEDKQAALVTTREVLLTLARLLAPFAPFFADYVYRSVGGKEESVHLDSWPETGGKMKAEALKLIEEMALTRNIVSLALEQRSKAGIKVRQPLGKLKLKSDKLKNQIEMLDLIKDEVNVKEIEILPNLSSEVLLETEITPALKEEGDLRELIRFVQEARKASGLTISDKPELLIETDPSGQAWVKKFEEEIKKSTLLRGIRFEPVSAEEVKIGELKFKLGLEK